MKDRWMSQESKRVEYIRGYKFSTDIIKFIFDKKGWIIEIDRECYKGMVKVTVYKATNLKDEKEGVEKKYVQFCSTLIDKEDSIKMQHESVYVEDWVNKIVKESKGETL